MTDTAFVCLPPERFDGEILDRLLENIFSATDMTSLQSLLANPRVWEIYDHPWYWERLLTLAAGTNLVLWWDTVWQSIPPEEREKLTEWQTWICRAIVDENTDMLRAILREVPEGADIYWDQVLKDPVPSPAMMEILAPHIPAK